MRAWGLCGLAEEVDMQLLTSIIKLWVFMLQQNKVFNLLPLCSPGPRKVWGGERGVGSSETRVCWSSEAPRAHDWGRWSCPGETGEWGHRPCSGACLPRSAWDRTHWRISVMLRSRRSFHTSAGWKFHVCCRSQLTLCLQDNLCDRARRTASFGKRLKVV